MGGEREGGEEEDGEELDVLGRDVIREEMNEKEIGVREEKGERGGKKDRDVRLEKEEGKMRGERGFK